MKIVSFILTVSFFSGNLGSLAVLPVKGKGIKHMPSGCEYNIAFLDSLAQRTDQSGKIIVIAHLGNHETRRNINYRRLHNVRAYLTEYLVDPKVSRSPEKIILAVGEKKEGSGQLDFYVGNKLFGSIELNKESDLFVGDCGQEPPAPPCSTLERKLFYPCFTGREKAFNE